MTLLKVCIMVTYVALFFPFLSAWVIAAARISGFWQIRVCQVKVSKIQLTILPQVRAAFFYVD